MGNKTVGKRSFHKSIDATLQSVLDTLEADDGKSFVEKKAQIVQMLTEQQEALSGRKKVDKSNISRSAAQIRDEFWAFGDVISASNHITLRKVDESDREGFITLQRHYSHTPAILEQVAYQNMLWSEHTEQKSLVLSIDHDGSYAGYCGIQDLSKVIWEISIELLPEKTAHGIGFIAISTMLDELRDRLGVIEFRIRIEPTNHASQRLFEKLGAVPNGVSELWLHDPEDLEELEESSADLIDDSLVSLANKFAVEPRTLLSHVLEYKLTWL